MCLLGYSGIGVDDSLREPDPPDLTEAEATPIPSQPTGSTPQQPVTAGISLSGFKDVFAIPDFRRLFWGQGISALGDWVGTLAFIVAAKRLAPDRPAAVAVVLVLRLLPSFFATPIGGVLSDRWDRKKIMIWSDVARWGLLLIIPFVPRIGVLYTLAFAQEIFSLVNLPARDASLPNMVPGDRLEAANALIMGSSFAGIPLAGPIFAILAWTGEHFPRHIPGEHIFRARPYTFAFFFDALTFLVSAWFIARITLPKRPPRVEGQPAERFWEALKDGTVYISRRPLLRGLAWAVTLGMLGGGVLFALGTFYVEETLGGGDVEFGWLMGLFGAGMVSGFLISQLKPPGGVLWMVRISLLVMGGVLIFMAVFPTLWIAYVVAIGFGASFSVAIIVAMSAVQARTDDEHRGRVMGTVHMLFRGALSFGALGAGAIATLVPMGGVDLPVVSFHPDKNQVALIVAGALIAAGTIGVRARNGGAPDDVQPVSA